MANAMSRRRAASSATAAYCLTHFNGTWVHSPNRGPPYVTQAPAAVAPSGHANPQSRHIQESPMCKRQHSWRWHWRSRESRCPFVRPSRASLCARLAGRRVLLYGDSLTQQFFVSLATLAGSATPTWRPAGCERTRHVECVRVCIGDSNQLHASNPIASTTAEICQRTKFGLALDAPPPTPHQGVNCSIRPSVVAPPAEKFPPACLRRFDVVILNEAAHWVGVDGALGLQDCLERAHVDPAEAARSSQAHVAELFEHQMRRDAEHLRTIGTRVLFRTSPPGYPTADILPPDTLDGVPPVFTAPSRSVRWAHALAARGASRFNHHMIPRLNEIARRAFRTAAHNDDSATIGLMDVEGPMLHRVDGHLDPLHYCLPGPVDWYTEVLFNYVMADW